MKNSKLLFIVFGILFLVAFVIGPLAQKALNKLENARDEALRKQNK